MGAYSILTTLIPILAITYGLPFFHPRQIFHLGRLFHHPFRMNHHHHNMFNPHQHPFYHNFDGNFFHNIFRRSKNIEENPSSEFSSKEESAKVFYPKTMVQYKNLIECDKFLKARYKEYERTVALNRTLQNSGTHLQQSQNMFYGPNSYFGLPFVNPGNFQGQQQHGIGVPPQSSHLPSFPTKTIGSGFPMRIPPGQLLHPNMIPPGWHPLPSKNIFNTNEDFSPNSPLQQQPINPSHPTNHQNQPMNPPTLQVPLKTYPHGISPSQISLHNPKPNQPILPHMIHPPQLVQTNVPLSHQSRNIESFYNRFPNIRNEIQSPLLKLLNPNRYMDSIDHIIHPYLFT